MRRLGVLLAGVVVLVGCVSSLTVTSGGATSAGHCNHTEKSCGSLYGIDWCGKRNGVESKEHEGSKFYFVLSKDYWGQGLMPEAVNTVVEYLFNRQFYDFLVCGHFLTNEQSRRVQEKCAFVPYCKMKYETRMGTVEDVEMTIRLNPKSKITQRFSIENRKLL